MNSTFKWNLLTTKAFVAGLLILLLNDFYLKYQYPGIVTGKLSDFAGLFIFPLFIAAFVNRPLFVYYATAAFFIFWKSSFSQSFIDAVSHITGLHLSRVVDYSDLIALGILPFSYRFYKKNNNIHSKSMQLGMAMIIGVLAVFSFCATSVPRQIFTANIKSNKKYELPFGKDMLLGKLSFAHGFSDTVENKTDSLFYVYFNIPEHYSHVTASVKVIPIDNAHTIIQLDSITKYDIIGGFSKSVKANNIKAMEKLTPTEFEMYFEQNFINNLSKENYKQALFFDNKKVLDKQNAKQ